MYVWKWLDRVVDKTKNSFSLVGRRGGKNGLLGSILTTRIVFRFFLNSGISPSSARVESYRVSASVISGNNRPPGT